MGNACALILLLAAAAPAGAAGAVPEPAAVALASGTAAAPPARSTATARRPDSAESPFNVSFWYDERGSRVNLDYRLRWDFADIRRLPGASLGVLRSPMASLGGLTWDLTRGASIGVYGVRIRPARMIVRREPPPAAVPGGDAGEKAAAADPEPSPWSGRFRLSLTPVIQDIRRDLRSSIERQLMTSGVNAALPQARGASREQKEALAEDAIRAGESMGVDSDKLHSDVIDDIKDQLKDALSPL